jgi:neurofibromin 1
MVSWGHGGLHHPETSGLPTSFLQSHVSSRKDRGFSSREVDQLDCTDMSNIVDTVSLTTRYLGQIIFYLSSSNWNLVFSRIRSRLAHLTTTIEDTPDLIELRLLQWSNLNRARLCQLMQETSNVFLHIKRPSQIAFASVMHSAIWNWIDANPEEFDTLVGSERRIDGNPEALFDMLYSMSDFSSSNAKRTAVFYPLLAMILVICPDLFKKVVVGESGGKSSGLSKKYSFMESLKKGLSGSKGFEPSAACYVDFIKAAMRISPRHSSSGLRSLLPEVLHDLKVSRLLLCHADCQNALFFGSHSNELMDSGLPVDGLVAMYCADPAHIGSTVFSRLWLDSDVSRATAVKACTRIVAEADCLPWLPNASVLRQEVAGSVRQVFKVSELASYCTDDQAAVANYSADRGGSKRPRMSSEASPSLLDLLMDILKLYEQDPRFALASTTGGNTKVGDNIDLVVPLISILLVGSGTDALKLHAKSALLAVLEQVRSDLSVEAVPETHTSNMWPAMLVSLSTV